MMKFTIGSGKMKKKYMRRIRHERLPEVIDEEVVIRI